MNFRMQSSVYYFLVKFSRKINDFFDSEVDNCLNLTLLLH